MKPLSWRLRRGDFLHCIATACLFAALATAPPLAAAQDQKPPAEEQKPKPPPPPPPPPKPPGGFGDLLNPPPAPAPATAEASSPPTAESQDRKTEEAAGLDAQLQSLRAKLEHQRDLTIANLKPLGNLGLVSEKARDLRVLVDRMRTRIYLPDPAPDANVPQRLGALQARWGDLVRPLIDGAIPAAPLSADRWGIYAGAMSRLYCDARVVPRVAPQGGMPLGGWAWTCLSDVFFHELAGIEAGVDRLLAAERARVTATLERLMTAAEVRVAGAPAEIAVHPSPQLLLRELTGMLHDVELEGVRLRIQELEYQKAAGGGTPAFRWLLETSPKVIRPSGGSSRTVSAYAGATVKANLGDSSASVTVTEPLLPRLARELHDAHFDLERLRLARVDPVGPDVRDAEVRRARALAGIAREAQSEKPR